MRELTLINTIHRKAKKREIAIEEIINGKDHTTHILKRSLSFVRTRIPIKDENDLQEWLKNAKYTKNIHKNHTHVMRVHSDADNCDTVICKTKGDMYFLVGKEIYNIVNVNILKFRINHKKN